MTLRLTEDEQAAFRERADAEGISMQQAARRDVGLLGPAVARPQTTVFGEDAYPTSGPRWLRSCTPWSRTIR